MCPAYLQPVCSSCAWPIGRQLLIYGSKLERAQSVPAPAAHYGSATKTAVMAGLVPAIHVFRLGKRRKTWMPGTRPGMTKAASPGMTKAESRDFINEDLVGDAAQR